MSLSEQIMNGDAALAVVGLGYVGMPLAVAFAGKGLRVIGYDLNKAKIQAYKNGIDPTREVGGEAATGSRVRSGNVPLPTCRMQFR